MHFKPEDKPDGPPLQRKSEMAAKGESDKPMKSKKVHIRHMTVGACRY